jgi:Flp pilus assembly protein TadG
MQALKTILRETKGAEIAEAAVVLPVLFALILALFHFGRAYNIYGTITQAAQQGARAAVVTQCATCGNTAPTAAQIATNIVAPALQASHLTLAAVTPGNPTACQCGSVACGTTVACDPGGTGAIPSICVQQNVILTNTVGATQACGTSVSFQYPYNFMQIDWPLPPETFNLQLKAVAQMQAENNQ